DDAAGGLSDASAQGDGEQGDGEQGDGEQGDGEQGDATASDAADGGTDKGDVGATSTYVMGDCGQGAPGYNSCVIQAALACLKPVGACKLTTSGAHQSTEWASGSSFGCTTDGGKDQIECTGLDGTGKACMTWTFTGLAAKSVTSTLKSGNKTYTMSFNGGGIQVTCADGSKETYATEKDLCSPMKSDGCTKTGGGSTCTPLVTCKPGGICPTGYSCHPGSNGCAQPCQPQGQCPPCRTCDGSTGLCI
ncbi:MAG: hypothetical protein KC502_15035, partial [Myxococcales bacterium]|nr:hypothetical protein [Myxococcales bacterium]